MKQKRRLRRFFASHNLPDPGEIFNLPPGECHHLRNLLRLREGDACLVIDGTGKEAEATVLDFCEDGRVSLRVRKCRTVSGREKHGRIRVCQALIRKGKIEYLIEKAQELGVDEFWPLEAERSIVKIDGEHKAKKILKWRKIVQEAAKQSGELKALGVSLPRSLSQILLDIPKGETCVFFHPSSGGQCFRDWFSDIRKKAEGKIPFALNLFFGPEGGFSEREILLAEELQKEGRILLAKVDLGRSILKADTAFLGVVSALKLLLD